jgi:DNA-binding transcriptional LysR family regulator
MAQGGESHVPVKPLRISSRQVLLLNALDQCRNMRRAAIAMNTTQPTASLLLQQLEQRLSVKLFERLPRGMEPTIYGEVLIRYAKGVSHDLEHAEAEIVELSKGAAGLIRIGSVYGTVPSLLTNQVIAFKKNNPRVRISIEVGFSNTLIPSLISGDLDIVLGRMPDQLYDHDLAIHFFTKPEHMSVIVRPGHKLAHRKRVKLSELFNLTWILSPVGSPMRSRVEAALKLTKMTSSLDIIETASLLAVTSLLEASDMISVVPRPVALHYEKYGVVKILPVDLSISMVNLGVITKNPKTLSPAVTEFLDYLKNTDWF